MRIYPGIVDVLKEPDLLADMHTIAERRHTMYAVNHALIRRLALKAFGLEGEAYASLGVGIQESLHDFIERTEPSVNVVHRYNATALLTDTGERIADVVFDITDGFRQTEPDVFETVQGIVAAHLEVPSSRNLALFGAAFSHATLLAQSLQAGNE